MKRANATGVRLSLLPMRPRPDLSEYFLKTEIFSSNPISKKYASKGSVFESFSPVHIYSLST